MPCVWEAAVRDRESRHVHLSTRARIRRSAGVWVVALVVAVVATVLGGGLLGRGTLVNVRARCLAGRCIYISPRPVMNDAGRARYVALSPLMRSGSVGFTFC